MTATTPNEPSPWLLRQTRIHFPRFDEAGVRIEPLEKGGSDRKFYRIICSPDQTIILVRYNLERQENRHYVEIAEFLAENRIRGPQIYFHDATEGLIWMEDLGTADLWSYREENWLVRRAFYESAICEIVKLHCLPETAAQAIRENLPASFDSALYRWEQEYFFTNCLGRRFGVPKEKIAELASLTTLREMTERLGNRPRLLIHRDFQSQNIMIRNTQAHLIDFQGMRFGLAEYDLASLLYDPYVALSASEREELLGLYEDERQAAGDPVDPEFRSLFHLCAIQRLMQALGAYGFLGLVKGHTAFLDHIPAAMKSLGKLVSEIDGLRQLSAEIQGL